MSPFTAAVVASAESGESLVSPYVFGGVALALLLLLLVITMMINVDR